MGGGIFLDMRNCLGGGHAAGLDIQEGKARLVEDIGEEGIGRSPRPLAEMTDLVGEEGTDRGIVGGAAPPEQGEGQDFDMGLVHQRRVLGGLGRR